MNLKGYSCVYTLCEKRDIQKGALEVELIEYLGYEKHSNLNNFNYR